MTFKPYSANQLVLPQVLEGKQNQQSLINKGSNNISIGLRKNNV